MKENFRKIKVKHMKEGTGIEIGTMKDQETDLQIVEGKLSSLFIHIFDN